MRIALILLSILALIFIGSISWYLVSQDWTWWLKKQNADNNQVLNTINASDYWHNQIKLEDQIKTLSGIVWELSQKNGNTQKTSEIQNQSGSENTKIVKLSGKFLSLIMPTVTPILTENHGIFDLHIFDIGTCLFDIWRPENLTQDDCYRSQLWCIYQKYSCCRPFCLLSQWNKMISLSKFLSESSKIWYARTNGHWVRIPVNCSRNTKNKIQHSQRSSSW